MVDFCGEIHRKQQNHPTPLKQFQVLYGVTPFWFCCLRSLRSHLIFTVIWSRKYSALSHDILGRGFNPFHILNSKRTQHADFRNTAAADSSYVEKNTLIPYSFMKFLVGWGSTIFIPDSSGVEKSTERTRDPLFRGTICQEIESTCNWKALQTKQLYVFSKQ